MGRTFLLKVTGAGLVAAKAAEAIPKTKITRI
jgi:hypothetical protein